MHQYSVLLGRVWRMEKGRTRSQVSLLLLLLLRISRMDPYTRLVGISHLRILAAIIAIGNNMRPDYGTRDTLYWKGTGKWHERERLPAGEAK